jgi:hypothetical protein
MDEGGVIKAHNLSITVIEGTGCNNPAKKIGQ